MRDSKYDEDPFRKIQQELKDIDLSGMESETELQARVQALLHDAATRNEQDEHFERIASDSLQDKVSQAASTPPPNTDEFEERFKSLEAKTQQAKGKRNTAEQAIEKERKLMRSDAKGMGLGLTLAYVIVGFPMLGAGIGWLMDRQTDSNVFTGIGALTGAVIGIGATIFLTGRSNSQR